MHLDGRISHLQAQHLRFIQDAQIAYLAPPG